MAFKQFQSNASNNWSDAGNWTDSTLPLSGDTVVVDGEAEIAAGSYDYASLIVSTNAVAVADPGVMLHAGSTSLDGGTLVGGTLETGTLTVTAGAIEGTTLVGTAIASGFTSADLGLSGAVSVDQQAGPGTDVLTLTHQLTIAAATELQFGEIDLQGAALVFTGGRSDAVLTLDPVAVLRAASGGSPGVVSFGNGTLANNGTVDVDAGETLRIAGTLVNTGTVSLASGAVLDLAGTETAAQLGTISGAGAVVFSGTLDNAGRTITLSSSVGMVDELLNQLPDLQWQGGTVEGGTLSGAGQVVGRDGVDTLVLDNVAVQGQVSLADTVSLTGTTAVAMGATLTVADAGTTAGGVVALGDGARLVAPTTVAASVDFGAGAGTLELTAAGNLSAGLSHFAVGDTVQFDGMSAGTLSLDGDVLTVSDGVSSAQLSLSDGGAPYSAGSFQLSTDSTGHLLLGMTDTPPATGPSGGSTPPGPGSPDPVQPVSDLLFDAGYYLASNPDVAAAGVDPLAHFEAFGWHEGRSPNALFDTNFYLANNPDVAAAGIDPLMHFEAYGWQEGRNPDPLFDTRYYLASNPDVAAAGVNPLAHFESYGWHEGRSPNALFDTGYYLANNPDVAAAGVDPLQHYETSGWKEGRNPSAAFDTNSYLNANPDVAAAGVNPLQQYEAFGAQEGRAVYAVS